MPRPVMSGVVKDQQECASPVPPDVQEDEATTVSSHCWPPERVRQRVVARECYVIVNGNEAARPCLRRRRLGAADLVGISIGVLNGAVEQILRNAHRADAALPRCEELNAIPADRWSARGLCAGIVADENVGVILDAECEIAARCRSQEPNFWMSIAMLAHLIGVAGAGSLDTGLDWIPKSIGVSASAF